MNPISDHKKIIPYDRSNCGVYIIDAKGIYIDEEVQQFAKSHGWRGQTVSKQEAEDTEEWELYHEFAEEATAYMNDYCIKNNEPIEWGWREGDWGLWFTDEELQD
tara:strand:+ start:44 stop:358 length:315 start_codon:yes stop_codon:yes gene_type:complete